MTGSPQDDHWMALAVRLAERCPPAADAFSVGAVIVAADGTELARGYSREAGDRGHAEEAALAKAAGDARLVGATIYTSLEPCSARASHPATCTELIRDAGLGRVVFALHEPPHFVVRPSGAALLAEAGLQVCELPQFAEAARAANAHLPA